LFLLIFILDNNINILYLIICVVFSSVDKYNGRFKIDRNWDLGEGDKIFGPVNREFQETARTPPPLLYAYMGTYL